MHALIVVILSRQGTAVRPPEPRLHFENGKTSPKSIEIQKLLIWFFLKKYWFRSFICDKKHAARLWLGSPSSSFADARRRAMRRRWSTGPRPTALWGRDQGFFYRPFRSNRRCAVPANRSGLNGYRKKPVKLKFEFKTRSYTGFEHLTGRLDRFTGPVWPVTGRFMLNSNFFLF